MSYSQKLELLDRLIGASVDNTKLLGDDIEDVKTLLNKILASQIQLLANQKILLETINSLK